MGSGIRINYGNFKKIVFKIILGSNCKEATETRFNNTLNVII